MGTGGAIKWLGEDGKASSQHFFYRDSTGRELIRWGGGHAGTYAGVSPFQ